MERYSIENFIADENELAEHYKEAGNEYGYKGKSKLVEYLKELKTYKNAEEQGLLLRLPCKVGTQVWKIKECSGGGRVPNWHEIYNVNFALELLSDFGKTVFLTKEEAEKELAKMKEV